MKNIWRYRQFLAVLCGLLLTGRVSQAQPGDLPKVVLLKETFAQFAGDMDDDDLCLDGLPVPAGRPVRIAYTCSWRKGLGRAELHIRVLAPMPPGGSLSDPRPVVGSIVVPLKEVRDDGKAGKFDVSRGAFEKNVLADDVPFHAMPALGRTVGGGRVTVNLDKLEFRRKVEEGDRVEMFVRVYAAEEVDAKLAGISETRYKDVVTQVAFTNWLFELMQEEARIRQLGRRQKKVFPNKK